MIENLKEYININNLIFAITISLYLKSTYLKTSIIIGRIIEVPMMQYIFIMEVNLLVRSPPKNPSITQKRPTTRLLCECELYASGNYGSDPQMKAVMENFNKQTQQRFEEYDERIQSKRKQCKDKCDKKIQKIILKYKLEKELMDKFATLHTDMQSDAIPTCICEKSTADKVEKGCLSCGGVFGGGVMPGFGAIGGTALYALNQLKPAAITAAKDAAVTKATDAATQAGIEAVRLEIEKLSTSFTAREGFVDLLSIVNKSTYDNGTALLQSAKQLIGDACINPKTKSTTIFYNSITYTGEFNIENFAQIGAEVYKTTFASKSVEFKAANVSAVKATYAGYEITIMASIVAIVVIVLIMTFIF
ncbi:rifin [Plasmodium falciparum IGH-CR14]|uniref:Rifin n=1 Tax=Plasmodium falciparum IGH-CR14 TaxID=580059 RepID=A0A0L1I7C8_PLAFA|nr:rifin [Plasmodium falciparum IGH-CR14]